MNLRKVIACLLLTSLIVTSLHVFAHFSDSQLFAQPTISGIEGGTESSGGSSLGGNHTCLACQSLQYQQAKTSPALALTEADQRALTVQRPLQIHSVALSATPSNRAPPLV
jgi:hypothetical protein